jgi:hypothetical protein
MTPPGMPGRRRPTVHRTRRARHGAPPDRPHWFTRARAAWALAGILTLLAMIAFVQASGVMTNRSVTPPTSPPPPSPPPVRNSIPSANTPIMSPPGSASQNSQTLATEFAKLENKLQAVASIAVGAVGHGQTTLTFGDWPSGPAWSTMKVPLVIAALREEHPPKVTDAMTAAITESDNAAAESIWESLGDPVTAAHKVEAVLRETGDPTPVQSQKVRPEFTAFGQTDWTLAAQIQFLSEAACDSRDDPVLNMMGEITAGQRWGLAVVPNARYKGGWGPSPSGSYLVRQIGLITTPTGTVAIAVAAQPSSGTFGDGLADLTRIGNWIDAHISELPTGHC